MRVDCSSFVIENTEKLNSKEQTSSNLLLIPFFTCAFIPNAPIPTAKEHF
jgi:hypothetical protein